MTESIDALFVQYIESGDDRFFDTIFDRFAPRIARFMAHRISSSEDVDELVQQTFLVVHRSRKEFRGDSKFTTWLWSIAVNLRRDYLRKHLFRARFRTVDSTVEGSNDPEDFERREAVARLQVCVSKLPKRSRDVIELHWYEELPFDEVAQILAITVSAAKTRAHRAYQKLRSCVESE